MTALRAAAVALLAAFITLFVVLALDVAWRIWGARAGFENGADVAVLLSLEVVRSVVTLSFVCVAVVAARRTEPGHTAFAFALLFFALWYVKFVSFAAYPGYLQQWLATGLNQIGVPKLVMRFVFGQPVWALAPALASFLAFATRYPTAPRPELVRSVHATGRRGMLREVALAGTDVRSLVHRAAAWALPARLVDQRALTVLGIGGAAALAFGDARLSAVVLVLLAVAFAFAFAYLRTASLTLEGPHRRRLARLGFAGASLALELIACGALAFVPGGGLGRITLALAAAAPLGALYFLIGFVRSDSANRTGSALAVSLPEAVPA